MNALPTEDELRDLVGDAIIARYWPAELQTGDAIESHIEEIVAELRTCLLLDVDADFRSYGSGYASYVHVFCAKSNVGSTVPRGETDYIDGITIYLGRLVPFAAYGAERRTRHRQASSGGFLDCGNLETVPDGDWGHELSTILGVIDRGGYMLPDKADYCRPLPIRLEWETNFGRETYFDAIFHWYD